MFFKKSSRLFVLCVMAAALLVLPAGAEEPAASPGEPGGGGSRAIGTEDYTLAPKLTPIAFDALLSSFTTRVNLSDSARDVLYAANERLTQEGVGVGLGNYLPAIAQLQPDWVLLDSIDNASAAIRYLDASRLSSCYAPVGKPGADIAINVSSQVGAGQKALLPMTYAVILRRDELRDIFGQQLGDAILLSPESYTEKIASVLLLQKETRQGPMADWFTRLVDGVLTPEMAIELDVIYGFGSLSDPVVDVFFGNPGPCLYVELDYYLLDDYRPDGAFVHGGYLIVPDGANDGILTDLIWLTRWTSDDSDDDDDDSLLPSYPSSEDGSSFSSGSKSSGGGGCGAGALGVPALASAAWLKLSARQGRARRRSYN
jgi:hypothetical protein